MSDLKKLIAIMNELADEFTDGAEVSKIKIQRWEGLLVNKYGIKQVEQAALYLLNNRSKYEKGFPKVSEIVVFIEGSQEDIEDIALEQFIKAKDSIMYIGSYRSIQFDDPIIHKVIESMGGWVNFCMTEIDKWPFREKEFIRYYMLYKKQEKQGILDDIPTHLQGISPTASIVKVKTHYPSQLKIEEPKDNSKSVMKELSNRIKNMKKGKKEDKKE